MPAFVFGVLLGQGLNGKMCGSIKELVLFILALHWFSGDVLATHFRGGIIMVRPVDGGAPAQVYIEYYETCRHNNYVYVHVLRKSE